MFELNFREERYLAFEGAGAISSWRIELTGDFRQFDYGTISDVVLHMRYTAREGEGGERFKDEVASELQRSINELALAEGRRGLFRLFSAKRDFSAEWHRFLHPAASSGDQTLTVLLTKDRFPFLYQNSTITINKVEVLIRASIPDPFSLATDPAPTRSMTDWHGLLRAEYMARPGFQPDASGPAWILSAWLEDATHSHRRVIPDELEDMFVVCHYSIA